MRWFPLVALVAGCAELGVVSDGTSLSVGRPSRGYLVDGVRLPDRGEGFITREVWRERENRYGTDELIDLITAVSRRMKAKAPSVKLVVADLSGKGGGERIAFHRSHQTGRDVDLLYYMRDANGQPFEPDAMHAFDARAHARDGSGLSVDIPRTWALVKELLTAPEAAVQWIFMYQPIALRLIEYAEKIGEPEVVIERARKACRQPGDSARHDDHMHVRVYCAAADRAYGCVDIGPLELLAEREAEPSPIDELASAMTASMAAAAPAPATGAPTDGDAARLAAAALGGAGQGAVNAVAQGALGALGAAAMTPDAAGAVPPSATSAASPNAVPQRLGRMVRTQLNLRSWR